MQHRSGEEPVLLPRYSHVPSCAGGLSKTKGLCDVPLPFVHNLSCLSPFLYLPCFQVPRCFLHYSPDVNYVPADVVCYLIDLFGVYQIPEDKPVWLLWYKKFPQQVADLRARALVRAVNNIVLSRGVHGTEETFATEIRKELTIHDDSPPIHLSQLKYILPRHILMSTPPPEEVDEEEEEVAAKAERERAAEASRLLVLAFVLFCLLCADGDLDARSFLRVY